MKRGILSAFLLMTTLLAGTACAQMNYELTNPYLTYEPLDEDEAMPVLVDVLDAATDPDDASITIIGGADGPTAISLGRQGQGTPRAACSALHFEPAKNVTWRMVFHEAQLDDLTVTLL